MAVTLLNLYSRYIYSATFLFIETAGATPLLPRESVKSSGVAEKRTQVALPTPLAVWLINDIAINRAIRGICDSNA